MRIAYIHADRQTEWNSAYWRCVVPTEALNRAGGPHSAILGHIQEFANHSEQNRHVCEDADVIVLQRGAMPDTLRAVRYWRDRGKFVVADIDDGYPQITAEHPAFSFWHQGRAHDEAGRPIDLPRPAIHDMHAGLREIGYITSPNRPVLRDWRERVGTRGAFIPNYLNLADYRGVRTRSPEDDGTIWVAWGGSAGHLISFLESGVSDALARVISKRPHVRFVMCGADTRILDRVPLKSGQKIHINWHPFPKWSGILANFDVGLIPTAGEFDARRSTLKPLEYSYMGIPWIAGHNPAYEGLEDYGTFVSNTADAWAAALEQAIDARPSVGRLARARAWAESMSVDKNVANIVAAYESLKGQS